MNPLVKLAVSGAGIAAGVIGNIAIARGWGAVFGEDAPTKKALKRSAKATAAARKQAKKEGLSRSEIRAIQDPHAEQPVWKVLLWIFLSGVAIKGFQELARKGAMSGTRYLTERRPRPNRG